MYACHSGSKHVVQLISEAGGDIEKKSKNGVTALHLSCAAGHYFLVQYLIDEC